MSGRFRRMTGGTYNLKAAESGREREARDGGNLACSVCLLDGSLQTFFVNKQETGQVLMDQVSTELGLSHPEYFGLQIPTQGRSPLKWLDLSKIVKKQLIKDAPSLLIFQVKYFVQEPEKLPDEHTRYLFFVHLRQEITNNRLSCPEETAVNLAAYVVQAEQGDFESSLSVPAYLSQIRLLPEPTAERLEQVSKLHEEHRGMLPDEAVIAYLALVKTLPLYGVELHFAQDGNGVEVQVGVMATGLVIFKNGIRIHLPWRKIVKLFFKTKQFFIQLERRPNEMRDNILDFNLDNYKLCKVLWKNCVEYHSFFRTQRNPTVDRPLLHQFFTMSSLLRGRPGYNASQTSIEESNGSKPIRKQLGMETSVVPDVIATSTPLKADSGRGELDGCLASSHEVMDSTSLSADSQISHCSQTSSRALRNSVSLGDLPSLSAFGASHRQFRSSPSTHLTARRASRLSLNDVITGRDRQTNGGVDHGISSSSSHDGSHTPLNQMYLLQTDQTPPNGTIMMEDLVQIKMMPDSNGKFGFNIKGGADNHRPVIVSRVAPGTPADVCIPRLSEGDQLVRINGREVSHLSHEEVVSLIRDTNDAQGGELRLLVRPNAMYKTGSDIGDGEPEFHFTPEEGVLHAGQVLDGNDKQALSMQQLQEGLFSGAALEQFENLYRKKPGMGMSCARLPQNVVKNRYRDISPYDETRILLDGPGDYINANYIDMEVPGGKHRYLACQGPLPSTCTDFWRMVWEQGSHLVVMLTTTMERGRVKCHQYWPDPPGIEIFGDLEVTCLQETCNPACVFRELRIAHLETEEERAVIHLQYVAWPDHGVPDDNHDFLSFVQAVSARRHTDPQGPMTVHCSAGIGRTGVLITMETALCLLENEQPVYPLDIVRCMRDQRAMMIQTTCQYKFVCEAILRVYEDGIGDCTEVPKEQNQHSDVADNLQEAEQPGDSTISEEPSQELDTADLSTDMCSIKKEN
uniref:tyrosine-protein phosphatase non-receptor type 4 isoform X2 n=1 Tax=Myxine glutinosa TaxID=7769 RepID=UPI00358F5A33